MTYLVEFQVLPNRKNEIVDKFELRGPNQVPGVQFQQAWISKQLDVIYVIGKADDEAALQKACNAWQEFGTYRYTEVVDIENY